MYGIEIIGSIFVCVLLSGIAFILARRSFAETDIVTPNEEVKQSKSTKKTSKVKIAKKETNISKDVKKTDKEIKKTVDEVKKTVNVVRKTVNKVKKIDEEENKKNETIKIEKKSKKVKHAQVEVAATVAPVVEKVSAESSTEWKKVSKPARKISKKEAKVDAVIESEVLEMEVIDTTAVEEQPIIRKETITVTKAENASKLKKSKKEETTNVFRSKSLSSEEVKSEEKQPEIKLKQNKEKIIVDEIKLPNTNEEMDLRRRIGELMSELDKQKCLNKEEGKSSLQTINQLNKELDTLKQKSKSSQSGEEKLTEELKKKNASFAEFRQQFLIVQSELTKNIVQVQSITREKDKLESRFKSMDENNKQLREKCEMFDKVSSEREQFLEKLSKVEEEFSNTKVHYNELCQTKEKELNDRINQFKLEKQRMQEQLVHVQTDLIEKNSTLQHIQQELLDTKVTYTDLLNDKIHLQQHCADLKNSNILIKQQLSLESSARVTENNVKVSEISKKCEDLQVNNDKLMKEKEALMKQYEELNSLHSEVDKLKEQISTLTEKLHNAESLLSQDTYKETCERLTKNITDIENEKKVLVNIIDQHKSSVVDKEELAKIQTLFSEREIQWKASLDQLEKESQEKVKSLTVELNTIKSVLSERDSEKEACDELRSKINELKGEKDNLVCLVEQYKTGLENTESILSKLQISVNEEENKWRESLTKSESEAEKCTKELETVYNELMRIRNLRADKNELNFAYHCVDKSLSSLIDEMEARMNHFESNLDAVIQERDNALAQVHMQMNGAATKDQSILHTNDLNNESEISKIKEDLLNQLELNKTLEIHCNKYQSLIEIGKDALEAEKIQVKTLKEELKLLQSKLSADVNNEL